MKKRIIMLLLVMAMLIPGGTASSASNTIKIKAINSESILMELLNVEKTGGFFGGDIYYSSSMTIKFSSDITTKSIEYLGEGSSAADLETWVDNLEMGLAPLPKQISLTTESKLTQPGMYLVSGTNKAGDGEQAFIIIKKADVPKSVNAVKTSASVEVNGTKVPFDAYNINGSNYFKLRDVATVLSGTPKSFQIIYDEATRVINISTGIDYVVNVIGSDNLAAINLPTTDPKAPSQAKAVVTNSTIYINGAAVEFDAYNVGGYNYFKLRDLGQTFNFGVTWDAKTNTIIIDTSTIYIDDKVIPVPAKPQEKDTGDRLAEAGEYESVETGEFKGYNLDPNYDYGGGNWVGD